MSTTEWERSAANVTQTRPPWDLSALWAYGIAAKRQSGSDKPLPSLICEYIDRGDNGNADARTHARTPRLVRRGCNDYFTLLMDTDERAWVDSVWYVCACYASVAKNNSAASFYSSMQIFFR